MQTIIFPTDFSKGAKYAFDFAVAIAQKTGAQVIALNAYDLPYAETIMTHSLLDVMKKNAEEAMEKVSEQLKEAGVKHKILVQMGNPIRVVKEAVEEFKADIVVLGTKGASGLEEVLIGSNAAAILHNVDCPVLSIPKGSTFNTVDTIVYGSDFRSKKSGKALRELKAVAELFNAKIIVTHVVVNYQIDKETIAEAKARISPILEGVNHTFEVIHAESVEDGLLEFAATQGADMVALMSKNYSFFEGLFHRSLSSKVAYHASIPYLALQEER
ncbi:MAG: universal stress protein [Cryomorphaceae bacterium]|nr:universal stress protein [Cryomorphaceae bacterium]